MYLYCTPFGVHWRQCSPLQRGSVFVLYFLWCPLTAVSTTIVWEEVYLYCTPFVVHWWQYSVHHYREELYLYCTHIGVNITTTERHYLYCTHLVVHQLLRAVSTTTDRNCVNFVLTLVSITDEYCDITTIERNCICTVHVLTLVHYQWGLYLSPERTICTVLTPPLERTICTVLTPPLERTISTVLTLVSATGEGCIHH